MWGTLVVDQSGLERDVHWGTVPPLVTELFNSPEKASIEAIDRLSRVL